MELGLQASSVLAKWVISVAQQTTAQGALRLCFTSESISGLELTPSIFIWLQINSKHDLKLLRNMEPALRAEALWEDQG